MHAVEALASLRDLDSLWEATSNEVCAISTRVAALAALADLGVESAPAGSIPMIPQASDMDEVAMITELAVRDSALRVRLLSHLQQWLEAHPSHREGLRDMFLRGTPAVVALVSDLY